MLRIGRRHETTFSVTCDVSADRQAPGEGGRPRGGPRYERQRHGLGRAFLHQVDVLLDRIREDPVQHQVVYRGVRRAIPRRFRYGLFYRIEGSAVLVFAVVHLHRDPSTWQDRDPGREG